MPEQAAVRAEAEQQKQPVLLQEQVQLRAEMLQELPVQVPLQAEMLRVLQVRVPLRVEVFRALPEQELRVLPLRAEVLRMLPEQVLQVQEQLLRMTCRIHRKNRRHRGFLYHN